ncbi:MAG: hypothetical protein KAG89_10130 [Fulvimarina manganoxydans]|uniref:COG3904 family protein n=1 Tax=Fulvimarina manganoxydans TaxID=937218 RepID=UPI002352A903|nr:hypothetical protein [Fulvimarina manganoxydans]MCK5932512.1 hypothetical protein [Fulvimarina manganoxydans]
MIGEEASPGFLERTVLAIPEGSVLRTIFVALLVLSGWLVYLDWQDFAAREVDTARTERSEPMPMRRPEPGDQLRPYLPKTIPVAPDRGEPVLPGYDGPVDSEAMTTPMAFYPAGDGVVSAVGRIEIGTAKAFRRFLAGEGAGASAEPTPRDVKRLVLHSPGGSVEDALAMAADIRANGISTEVPADGYCASACPLVLAGGVTRAAGEAAWIGLHQVYAVDIPGLPQARDFDRSLSDIQGTIARCQQLLVTMGIDPAIWIKAMETPPEDLYVLTEEELVASRFVRPFPDDERFIGPRRPGDFRLATASQNAEAPVDPSIPEASRSAG